MAAVLAALRDAQVAALGEPALERLLAICPLDGVPVDSAETVATDDALMVFAPARNLYDMAALLAGAS